MIDLEDRKPRDLFVDEDGDHWLVLEHGQWLHFGPNGDARVAFAGPDSYSPHLATAEEIKAFCERFMPVVSAPSPFDGLTIQPWDEYHMKASNHNGALETVGFANSEGQWRAWFPGITMPFAAGKAAGSTPEERLTAARNDSENALRSRGAKL